MVIQGGWTGGIEEFLVPAAIKVFYLGSKNLVLAAIRPFPHLKVETQLLMQSQREGKREN